MDKEERCKHGLLSGQCYYCNLIKRGYTRREILNELITQSEDYESLLFLGRTCSEKQAADYELALAAYRRCKELKPDDPYIRNALEALFRNYSKGSEQCLCEKWFRRRLLGHGGERKS